MLVVNKVVELACLGTAEVLSWNTIVLYPDPQKEPLPLFHLMPPDGVGSKLSKLEVEHPDIYDEIIVKDVWKLGLSSQGLLFASVLLFVLPLWVLLILESILRSFGLFRRQLSHSPMAPTTEALTTDPSFSWLSLWLWLLWLARTASFVLSFEGMKVVLPRSASHLKDWDQIAVFVVSGILIILDVTWKILFDTVGGELCRRALQAASRRGQTRLVQILQITAPLWGQYQDIVLKVRCHAE